MANYARHGLSQVPYKFDISKDQKIDIAKRRKFLHDKTHAAIVGRHSHELSKKLDTIIQQKTDTRGHRSTMLRNIETFPPTTHARYRDMLRTIKTFRTIYNTNKTRTHDVATYRKKRYHIQHKIGTRIRDIAKYRKTLYDIQNKT